MRSTFERFPPRVVPLSVARNNPSARSVKDNLIYAGFLVLLAVVVFIEYFALGSSSYTRLGDHQDSFLPRGILAAESQIPGWISGIQFGISSDYVTHRGLSMSSWLFTLNPSTTTPTLLLLISLVASGLGMRLLFATYGLGLLSTLCATAYLWIFMASEDLYWYVIAWSFTPVVIWLLVRKGNRLHQLIAGTAAGVLFVITNYFALTSIYLAAFIVVHLLIDTLVRKRKVTNFLSRSAVFLATLSVGFSPSFRATFGHLSHSAREQAVYYDYGFRGALALLDKVNQYSLVPLLVAVGALFFAWQSQRPNRRSVLVAIAVFGLFFVGFSSQFYGALAPLVAEELGIIVNIPLQRFSLILPLVVAVSIPVLFQSTSGQSSATRAFLSGPRPNLVTLLLLVIIASTTPQFFSTKLDHIEGWQYNANLGWANSRSWETIDFARGTHRVAIITDRSVGLIPGHAQLAGFMTIGGSETASQYYKEFWATVDKSTDTVPNHSHYLGWNNAGRFQTEPIERLLDINLLRKVGVGFVVSAYPLSTNELHLVSSGESTAPSVAANPTDSRLITKILGWLDNTRGAKSLWIYEIKNPNPRVWLASSVALGVEQFDSCLVDVTCAFIHDAGTTDITTITAEISPIEYTGNGFRVETSVAGDGVLVLNESWSPHWEAEVNGESVEILRVNHNFMAVEVSSQSAQVNFLYKRPW